MAGAVGILASESGGEGMLVGDVAAECQVQAVGDAAWLHTRLVSVVELPFFVFEFSWPLTFTYSHLRTISFGTWYSSLACKPLRHSYSAHWHSYLVSSLYKPLYFRSTDLSRSHTSTEVSLGHIFLRSLYFLAYFISQP